MSAVMKDPSLVHADENTDMAVIEPKSLAEMLAISDQLPDDFYKNTEKYQAQLDVAIATAKSLVHEITDEGRKLAKSDAAIIRKYAKTTNGFSLSVFRSLTDKVKLWKDGITGKTKQLESEADNIMARFEKIENEKLDSIKTLLANTLDEYRIEIGLRPEFYGDYDLSPMVKLSGTLTDGGKLTSKALGFVKTIANGKLTLQQRFDSRVLILENRCLRADINPPLTHVHLGTVMFAEDDVFNAKVEELVNAEIERRAEMAARIERQNAEENQKKIDDALKLQQAETDRKAQEKAQQELATNIPPTPESLRKSADSIAQSAQYADRSDDKAKDLAEASKLRQHATELEQQQDQQLPETRTVIITATFEFSGISNKTSNDGVERFFRNKLPEQMQVKILTLSSQNA